MGFFDKARGKLKTPFQEGAGLKLQTAWRALPEWKKNQLRHTLKDSDHDGVPDKFDCQPFNSKRQDDPDYVPFDKLSRQLQYNAQFSNPSERRSPKRLKGRDYDLIYND